MKEKKICQGRGTSGCCGCSATSEDLGSQGGYAAIC